MTMMTALKSIEAIPRDISRSRLASPMDPDIVLRRLNSTVAELKNAVASLRPPDTGKIERLVRRYREAGNSLAGFRPYEIRTMTWNNDLLADDKFRYQLAEYVRTGEVKPSILVLSKAYFNNWGNHVQPEIFEQILRVVAIAQSGVIPLLGLYKNHAGSIFSCRADSFLRERIFSSKEMSVSAALSEWDIPPTSPLAKAVIDSFTEFFLKEYSAGNQWILDHLYSALALPAASTKTLQMATERLILNNRIEKLDGARKKLEEFVVGNNRLGDPRLQHNIPNWVGIDPAAQRKFKSWRTAKDLVFFFENVLPEGLDRNGRKQFWLEYVDQVEDSIVALCSNDEARLELTLKQERIDYRKVTGIQDISCFVMRFRNSGQDFVVAEFSENGRVRFFSFDTFVKNVRSIERNEFAISELKAKAGLLCDFPHLRSWQWKAQNALAQLGVRPR